MNNEEKIIKYLFGELDESQIMAFETEIQTSKKLAKELEEYKDIFLIIEDVETIALPETAQPRFNKMLDAEIKELDLTKTKVVTMRPNYLRMISIAASFALLGLFIGYQVQSNGSSATLSSSLSEGQKNEFIQLVGQDRTSQKISGLGLLKNISLLDNEVISTLEDVLYNDPSTNVRLAVIDALKGHVDQEEVKDILLKALTNIDKPVIKISIIQAVSRTESKQMLPALERVLQEEDLDKSVRDELHVGIMQLSMNI